MADIVASTQRIIVNPASQNIRVLNTRFDGDYPDISEAPEDNKIYVRKNAGWVKSTIAEQDDTDLTGLANGNILSYNNVTSKWEPVEPAYVPIAGGTMTGALTAPSLTATGAITASSLTATGAITAASLTTTGNVDADRVLVGSDGGGDADISFWDDNTNTRRTFRWDNSENDWRVEDNGSVMRVLWHDGNDGAGSGLDADTVDTYQPSGGSVPPSGAQLVRSHTNGYIYAGWINTVSGATTNAPTKIYCTYGTDTFIRYVTPATFRTHIADFTEFCNPQTRILNSSSTRTIGTIYSVNIGATIGGVTTDGAKAVILNIAARCTGTGYLTVWGYHHTTPTTSTINLNGTNIGSNQITIPIDSSQRFKYEFNDAAGNLIIVDVVGFIF